MVPKARPFVLIALACAPAALAQSYRNFESPPVHPIRVSPDGSRLFVVNPPDGRLSVYSLLDPGRPALLRDVPVGLEPVSVAVRTNDEAWVANWLSDSVSVVSVSAGRVVATLPVGDEPCDVAIAGGRVFVSCAASDQVFVFDALTRARLGVVAIPGKDPRALAVRADGSALYVLVHRSGNGTTILPEGQAPPQPPPTNPALPAPPRTSQIIAHDDPAWASQIRYVLPDHDVCVLDPGTLAITRTISGVGTTLYDLVHDAARDELFVANTEARNLVRFEPALRGHAIDSRVTRIALAGGAPTAHDLNPGIDYTRFPNPAALATALSEPMAIVHDAARGELFVAAHGTDRLGILDAASGAVVARLELGTAPGSQADPLNKRGPRGLARHPAGPQLYVFQRLSLSIAVVDVAQRTVLRELDLSHDPEPLPVRQGRGVLYDAKLSANGTMSCAACHVDADLDGLAWDLGNPGGVMEAAPSQPFPFNLGIVPFHPMKGPMTTQTLKGLDPNAPFHWRGDRPDLAAFERGFDDLLGQPISAAHRDAMVRHLESIEFPPNPNQNLDRTFASSPANRNAAAGASFFQNTTVNTPLGNFSCATCHALPDGTNRRIITAAVLLEAQQMKVPQLRNMYRKVGATFGAGTAKAGFGFTHDGAIGTMDDFLALRNFNAWPSQQKDDIAEFMLAFDTGTAPAVGHQITVDGSNVGQAAVAQTLALLESQAGLRHVDVVVRGTLDGFPRGARYDAASARYVLDRAADAPLTRAALLQTISAGRATWTFLGVPPGSGVRLGIDRDDDGILDGDEGLRPIPPSTPGCRGDLALFGNRDPRLGEAGFAMVTTGAQPAAAGVLATSPGTGSLSLLGVAVLLDLFDPGFFVLPAFADANGTALVPLPLPNDPNMRGLTLFQQAVFLDSCGREGFAASNAVRVTLD